MKVWQSLLLVVATLVFEQGVFGRADLARAQNNYPNRSLQLVVTVERGRPGDYRDLAVEVEHGIGVRPWRLPRGCRSAGRRSTSPTGSR